MLTYGWSQNQINSERKLQQHYTKQDCTCLDLKKCNYYHIYFTYLSVDAPKMTLWLSGFPNKLLTSPFTSELENLTIPTSGIASPLYQKGVVTDWFWSRSFLEYLKV